ncbi:MAG: preprotein translocase subunit SecE [Micrococcus sp.]|nr:preprotein translocase subunit SecE [Micrococcus sp.]
MREATLSESAVNGEQRPEQTAQRRGFFSGIILFLRQVVDELRKVVTPTRDELLRMTGVVLAFVAIMILLVMGLDWLFGTGAGFTFGDPGS